MKLPIQRDLFDPSLPPGFAREKYLFVTLDEIFRNATYKRIRRGKHLCFTAQPTRSGVFGTVGKDPLTLCSTFGDPIEGKLPDSPVGESLVTTVTGTTPIDYVASYVSRTLMQHPDEIFQGIEATFFGSLKYSPTTKLFTMSIHNID